MDDKKLKVLQIGCGKMSKFIMQYVYQKGGQIVGAVDINPEIIGKDIATIMESKNKNVIIESIDKLEELLIKLKPDIAIITTMSLLNDVKNELFICAKCGINAITTCEEAFFASNSNSEVFKDIDTMAKANNCTITGCGYQDFAWGNLITTLAGSTHTITKIKGSSSYNVEDYGIALAKAHGAGLTLEEFDKDIASIDKMSEEQRNKLIKEGNFAPSYMWNTVGWLADKLNLTITSMDQKCVPQTYSEELHSTTLNLTIPAGNATGMSAVVSAKTKEGIDLEAECVGKVYSPNDFDKNEWTIIGEPTTNIIMNKPDTVKLTCADVVNRIPDVINSKPGFIPTSQMPEMSYRLKALNEYVK